MFLMPLVTRPRVRIWLFLYWLIISNTFSYWSIFYCLWGQTPGHSLKLPITIFLYFKTIKRFLLSIFEFLVLDRTVSGQLASFISYLILSSYKWVPWGIWIFLRVFISPPVYPQIIYTRFLLLQDDYIDSWWIPSGSDFIWYHLKRQYKKVLEML